MMNYNEIVDNLVNNFVSPCDAEVPPGMYRRVMWEKYNPQKEMKQPAVGEEWDTEIIPLYKHLYTVSPFGDKSTPLGIEPPPDPGLPPPVGVWCDKIAHRFASQTELEEYVASIGATLLPGNDWYGADISKQSLFINPTEIVMYKLENCGGVLINGQPYIDIRTMMQYNADTESFTSINFSGLDHGQKTKYLRHYEDKPCTYVGFAAHLPPDLTPPGIPATTPPSVGNLPADARMRMRMTRAGCIPVDASFPYTAVARAVTDSLGRTRKSLKAAFSSMPGISEATEGLSFATMYDRLCSAAEEAYAGAAAMSQYALQAALMEFKKIISVALNIVGGGWDLIKSFLPSLSIAGVGIDILELVFSGNGVQSLVQQFKALSDNYDSTITSIYAAIGSAYDYAKSKVKMKYRDLVDAVSTLYDWCLAQFQNACVALCKLLGDLAQIWSIPPLLPGPNPVWLAIKAVRDMFASVQPLEIVMSGNFPGFTAMDIYEQASAKVDAAMDSARAQIKDFQSQMDTAKAQLVNKTKELKAAQTRFSQYLNGMWEDIKAETTKAYEQAIQALGDAVSNLSSTISNLESQIASAMDSISDTLKMGVDAIKELPIMSQINKFLGLCGMAFEDLLNIKTNATTGAATLYEGFVGGLKSLKDLCYTIYNQVSTLALSMVTQWVNKLLGILGLNIAFPPVSVCVPILEFN